MFGFHKIPQADLEGMIRNASAKKGVNESVLEKDYWVCFALDYLFRVCKWKDAFTFKGGTSLSKCFQLINRFSEDIDLILDWRVLGYEEGEPWLARSRTKQNVFNDEANEKAEIFLKEVLLPQMRMDFERFFEERFDLSIDENDPMTILFHYPKTFSSPYLSQVVRLEIGPLAAWTPSTVVKIVPDLFHVYPMLFDGDGIEVRTVAPERTFWEKATILHHEANRPLDRPMPARYARHYYDLCCMVRSPYKERAYAHLELLDRVIRFKQQFYPRAWAQYEKAVAKTIRLTPPEERFEEIRADYERMQEMFFEVPPSFEEMMETIRMAEAEIHKLSQE